MRVAFKGDFLSVLMMRRIDEHDRALPLNIRDLMPTLFRVGMMLVIYLPLDTAENEVVNAYRRHPVQLITPMLKAESLRESDPQPILS